MPTYNYKCDGCEMVGEFFHGMMEDPEYICPDCDIKLRKLISAGGGVIFKGSGFYNTDYKKIAAAAEYYNTPRKDRHDVAHEATVNWEKKVVADEKRKGNA